MLIAKIKSGTCPNYLTEGKEYPVIQVLKANIGIEIEDDWGQKTICYVPGCSHLSGGSWELYEKEAK
jgi:hypothetical protein